MSKVLILTERNSNLKYEENKRILFKSRLNMSSSHRKNNASLSITNSQLNLNKKLLYIKDIQKSSNKKEKINPYNYKKNYIYINGNQNLNDRKNIINFNNFNSSFNHFSNNIKHNLINNNLIKEKYIYCSNKTFINKSLNNSVIGKPFLGVKKIKNIEKNKLKKKIDLLKAKKKILSLSNSLTTTSKRNKNIDYSKYNKKQYNIHKNYINKNIFTIKESEFNNLKLGNYPKLTIKDFKRKHNNKSKSIHKGIHNSYNLFQPIKLGKSEDKKNSLGNINHANKMKLKKTILNSKFSKNKINKYHKMYAHKNNNKKIYRNNFRFSYKEINKTDITANNNNEKQKIIKDKEKDLIKRNIYTNRLEEENINKYIVKEEIKVRKIENAFNLRENTNKKNSIDSNNSQEEELKEDSNILSLEDVQDIIKYYDFEGIEKYDHYLFYRNDYKLFMENKKYILEKALFEESESLYSLYNKKIEKTGNKKNFDNKKINVYYKNTGLFSPNHIIHSNNKIYTNFKK